MQRSNWMKSWTSANEQNLIEMHNSHAPCVCAAVCEFIWIGRRRAPAQALIGFIQFQVRLNARRFAFFYFAFLCRHAACRMRSNASACNENGDSIGRLVWWLFCATHEWMNAIARRRSLRSHVWQSWERAKMNEKLQNKRPKSETDK